MKKIFLFSIILLTLFLAISSVSATENVTDVLDDVDGDTVGGIIEENAFEESISVENDNLTEDADSESERDIYQASHDDDIGNSVEVESYQASDNNAMATSDVTKATSKMATYKSASYDSFLTKLTFKLTADGKNLATKTIKVSVDGKRYNITTDINGIANLYLTFKKGSCFVYYIYSGDATTEYLKGKFTVCTGASYKTHMTVADKDINYRAGSRTVFGIKLCDEKGNALKNQVIRFTIKGKTYTAKTASNGYAKIFVKLNQGYHKMAVSFWANKPYLKSMLSHTIYARPAMGAGNGYWVFSDNMNSVNFQALKNNGCKQILLHVHSISVHGQSAVESWIANANRHGIKVHLWMQICYGEGGWVSPVRDDGSFKYAWMNSKISEAISYSKVKGAAGVHLDYVRYGGTAHNHINAVESINYIVKKASLAIHKVRANSIFSIAVMPEPDMMHYYYGQDIPTLSKYVDAIIPMAYCGNYGQSNNWLTSVTSTFVKQSNGAQIWCGLQGYVSDYDVTPLSHSALLKQAKAAKDGGAAGSIIFRHGYCPNLKFTWV
ncbi:hypothetical protein [uncultured Methanobrevibacter sp.]|uniref:hypothetical protein n=1 Tax=uncultured Methanobrevibacter sp. TaxID=253161 RepID=UPI00260BAB28|nr:hypothetical protein [uncultured Methanobrevibacter sp.]